MRPYGFHPGQVLAQLVDGLHPTCPVECGTPEGSLPSTDVDDRRLDGHLHVAAESPAVEPLRRQQPVQACRVVRVGRWSIDCSVHGFVRVDELSYPLTCPCSGEGV